MSGVHLEVTRGHAVCATHKTYALSCEEFDDLRSVKPGRCQMCDTETDRLEIDHDHSLGMWAVRGLLCRTCNSWMGLRDAGRNPSPLTDAYVAATWHARQASSAAKARRTMRRADCPLCGHNVSVTKAGVLTAHYSRNREVGGICNPPSTLPAS